MTSASDIPEAAGDVSQETPAGAVVTDGGAPASPPLSPALPQPSGGYGPHIDELPPASSRATTTFVLGLLGLLGPVLIITFPAAIPAWILGHIERREIRAGRAPALGYGMATSGWIMGIVGSVLFGLLLLLFIAVIAIIVMAGAFGGMSGIAD